MCSWPTGTAYGLPRLWTKHPILGDEVRATVRPSRQPVKRKAA